MDDKPTAAPLAPAKSDPPQPKAVDAPKKLSADELMKKHLGEVSKMKPEDVPETFLLVSEHADEAKLERWQLRTLLARFHGHGLHLHARIHPEVFKSALDEALNGRV